MIIRLQDCRARLWKNGLGSTREIAVQPTGSDSNNFLWRVSIAAVDTAAPFSSFLGIDRHIALLSGRGFSMRFADGEAHALTTLFAPFAFSGDDNVSVELVDGPTRDFNLMVRRARARCALSVLRDAQTLAPDTSVVLLYCAAGDVDVNGAPLATGDSWLTQAKPAHVTLQRGAVALMAHVTPR